MSALHLLGSQMKFIVYMQKSQEILCSAVDSAKPNPINTLRVTDTLARTQAFECRVLIPSIIILTKKELHKIHAEYCLLTCYLSP